MSDEKAEKSSGVVEIWTLSIREMGGEMETNWGCYSTALKALETAHRHLEALEGTSWFVVCLDFLDADPLDGTGLPPGRGIRCSITCDGRASSRLQPTFGAWAETPETTLIALIEGERAAAQSRRGETVEVIAARIHRQLSRLEGDPVANAPRGRLLPFCCAAAKVQFDKVAISYTPDPRAFFLLDQDDSRAYMRVLEAGFRGRHTDLPSTTHEDLRRLPYPEAWEKMLSEEHARSRRRHPPLTPRG